MASSLSDRAYRLLTEDDDEGRACEAISDEACVEAPRNYLVNAGNGAATKLAEQVASPGVVLPLMLATVGAPIALVGALEPVRRALSFLPQLPASGRLRRFPVRKWFWVVAGLVQAACLVVMAVVAGALGGVLAGVLVVVALAVFSVASGIGSLAFQDVIGKTIPKPKRGQLLGLRATAGGMFTLAVGLVLRGVLGQDASRAVFVVLLLAAAALWVLGAALFATTVEQAGATSGGRNGFVEAREGLRSVRTEPTFRRYVVARTLLSVVEVAVPFYALTANMTAVGPGAIGVYLAAIGVANIVSNPFWGRIADGRSTRLVLILGGLTGMLATVTALVLAAIGGVAPILFAVVFLLAATAEAGVRLARRAWVVNAAPTDERPLWVSTSNVLAGIVTLTLAGLGVIAQFTGVVTVLWVVLALAGAGVVATVLMPEDSAVSPA
jgi:hypothetical protein